MSRGPASALERLWRDQAGVNAIQFAFVAPAFLLLLFGGFDGARALWIRSSMEKAVVDAARCAAISPTACPDVPQYAASMLDGFAVTKQNFSYNGQASCGVGGYNKGYEVIGTYTLTGAIGTLKLPNYNGITLTVRSCHF